MDYDVVIIGGGPSGLATAIKLAQTFKEKNLDKFSLDTLRDRYLWQEETSPQEAFARAAVFASTYKDCLLYTSPSPRDIR